ncbi:MAG: response regulator [Puia sp.]|nr:response regulator [Puia sp.]
MNKPLRFICVDDDVFALTLAEKLIQGFNEYTETIIFSSAREASKFIMEEYDLMKNKISTVLLTDLHMPETDGFALLEDIEKIDNAIMRQLHVFVVSAAASSGEIEKVLSHNCVKGFYSKPLSIEKIEQIIKRIQYPD